MELCLRGSIPVPPALCLAEMKVKKNNFVEQNEIRRENSFVRWTPDRTNGTGLFVMCVLFPVVIYALSKAEWEYRDVAVSKLEKPRARF